MNRAVVCIVGRPNVGKSSIFNRIVGSRISITEDTPGVTRDRIYAEGEWLGKNFSLIDTGGIEIGTDDLITQQIKVQVDIGLETADVIIFVVDGISGLLDQDLEIASYLRKSEKKTVLAVNKIDNVKDLNNIYEFYELGFGDPMAISAEHGLGLGDLLDEVIKYFPEEKDVMESEDLIKVAVIGKPNAGKSSLINNILGEERVIVTDIPGTTRDAIDTYFSFEDKEYMFIDTAGLRRKRSIDELVERYSVIRTLTAVDRSDIAVLVIDATEGVTEQDTKIAGYAFENGKAIIIAVNKWDLVEKETNTMRDFERQVRNDLSFITFAPIIFISAKTGQRVNKLFTSLDTVYTNYSRRASTGALNDVINRAVLMNQPNSDKGKRVKIMYATQVSTKPPMVIIFAKNSSILHFSYKRYIENQIRESFDFTGTPLIIDYREKGE